MDRHATSFFPPVNSENSTGLRFARHETVYLCPFTLVSALIYLVHRTIGL